MPAALVAPNAPSGLHRLGRAAYRRRWRVVGAWLAAIVVLVGLSGAVGDGYDASFGDFESEATRGFDLLEAGFGGGVGENQGTIVFTAEQGVDDPEVEAAMTELFRFTEGLEGGAVTVVSPYDSPQQIAFQGPLAGQVAFATVVMPDELDFVDIGEHADTIRAQAPEIGGVEVLLGGQMFADFEPPDSEIIGLGFAIVILVLAFGSVLAMGLPIGMAVAGIGAGVAIVGLVSNVVPMPEFTTTIAIMLGLGVGIDYALFIVTRFRENLHRGMPGDEAAGHAIDTAGRAVLFAGTTVVISVLGMLVMGLGFIQGLGVGSAIAVLATMVASVTLLPALLGVVGERLEVTRRRGVVAAGLVAVALVGIGLGVDLAAGLVVLAGVVLVAGSFVPALRRPLAPRRQRGPRETFWYRYSRFVQHHSWLSALGGLAILGLLALPVFGLRLGFSDEGNYAEGTETREAYDLLAAAFGPGFNGPLVLVAELPDGTAADDVEAVTRAIADADGVALASPAETAPGFVRWFVIPATAPQDEATERLVRDLRGPALAEASPAAGIDVLVTSSSAINIDFSDYLSSRYALFFTVVLGLSFLLLMMVFRSLLVPLKAVLVNLLSIGAAYGIVVAVFQWGWGAELFDLAADGAPIEPFIPMMLFAIVFGLSMDYEVFLLSRMKEEYDRTGDNANAVADGLAVTARVITAAALIMVVVFGSFLLESDRVVKLMGTGLALAVLLDATVVRMLLVPATMELLGDRNWWLPRWLDRLLPVVHVEGAPDPDPVDGVDGERGEGTGDRELVGTGS